MVSNIALDPASGRPYVFPANAGMIPSHPTVGQWRRGVPRECGDDPSSIDVQAVTCSVFPANAGMILTVHVS